MACVNAQSLRSLQLGGRAQLRGDTKVSVNPVNARSASMHSEVAGLKLGLSCATSSTTPSSSRLMNVVRASSDDEGQQPSLDNCTVLVVGGGGTGMELLRQLAKTGSWVTALQRGDKFRPEIESLGAMLAVGDVMQPETIARALRSNVFDAVICTVSGGRADLAVESEGTINVIKAAEAAKVPRFILVTSIGTGDSASAISEKEMEILGPVLQEKEKAEFYLKSTDLDWTIVRPGGLLKDPPTGHGLLTEDRSVIGVISRSDLASLICRLLFSKESRGKVLAAVDASLDFGGRLKKDINAFVPI